MHARLTRLAELDRRREISATHADDTGGADPAGDFFRAQLEGIGQRLALGPTLLAVGLKDDGR